MSTESEGDSTRWNEEHETTGAGPRAVVPLIFVAGGYNGEVCGSFSLKTATNPDFLHRWLVGDSIRSAWRIRLFFADVEEAEGYTRPAPTIPRIVEYVVQG